MLSSGGVCTGSQKQRHSAGPGKRRRENVFEGPGKPAQRTSVPTNSVIPTQGLDAITTPLYFHAWLELNSQRCSQTEGNPPNKSNVLFANNFWAENQEQFPSPELFSTHLHLSRGYLRQRLIFVLQTPCCCSGLFCQVVKRLLSKRKRKATRKANTEAQEESYTLQSSTNSNETRKERTLPVSNFFHRYICYKTI